MKQRKKSMKMIWVYVIVASVVIVALAVVSWLAEFLFNNSFSREKGEKWVQIGVFAETILEAKRQIKDMGYAHLRFERIERYYGRTGKK